MSNNTQNDQSQMKELQEMRSKLSYLSGRVICMEFDQKTKKI